MINLTERSAHYVGLLVFDYDEKNDIFSEIKNRIIIPKGTEIPVEVTTEIYAHKNVFQDKVLLKIGITQCNVEETDPQFVNIIASQLLHLYSNYPTDRPLQIILSLDDSGILRGRVINLLNNDMWRLLPL